MITQATLSWIILFGAIIVGAAGGLAFLASVVRDRFYRWLWEGYETRELLPGCDGVWFTDMLKELE